MKANLHVRFGGRPLETQVVLCAGGPPYYTAQRPVPSGACENTGESGLKPWPPLPVRSKSSAGRLSERWAIHDECIQRNERSAYVQRRLSWPNCGISPTNPAHNREDVLAGAPAMVALKMAADGTLIVPHVFAVMARARERRVADLRYSNGKVS